MLRVTSKYEVHTTKCYREHTLGMIYILSVLLCIASSYKYYTCFMTAMQWWAIAAIDLNRIHKWPMHKWPIVYSRIPPGIP